MTRKNELLNFKVPAELSLPSFAFILIFMNITVIQSIYLKQKSAVG